MLTAGQRQNSEELKMKATVTPVPSSAGIEFMQLKLSEESKGTFLVIPAHMIDEFKEVIQRGTAFGTQTSPAMKIFADTLLGRISWTSQGTQLQEGN